MLWFMLIRKPINEHRGWYNASPTNEVAIIIVGKILKKRDIIYSRDTKLVRTNEIHRVYDALQ